MATLPLQNEWLNAHLDDMEGLLEQHRDEPAALWIHRAMNYVKAVALVIEPTPGSVTPDDEDDELADMGAESFLDYLVDGIRSGAIEVVAPKEAVGTLLEHLREAHGIDLSEEKQPIGDREAIEWLQSHTETRLGLIRDRLRRGQRDPLDGLLEGYLVDLRNAAAVKDLARARDIVNVMLRSEQEVITSTAQAIEPFLSIEDAGK